MVEKDNNKKEMICVIRIAGRVGLDKKVEETLKRLRLGKKYTCSVIPSNTKNWGMLKKVRDFVAFGIIAQDTYEKLKKERGKKNQKGELKKYFRLHPPRGGIETKHHYPKGVLGNHKEEINDLVERML